jgi:hypothetical protein
MIAAIPLAILALLMVGLLGFAAPPRFKRRECALKDL